MAGGDMDSPLLMVYGGCDVARPIYSSPSIIDEPRQVMRLIIGRDSICTLGWHLCHHHTYPGRGLAINWHLCNSVIRGGHYFC